MDDDTKQARLAIFKKSNFDLYPKLYLVSQWNCKKTLASMIMAQGFYDPVVARWASIDALAEVNRKWTPYAYVNNNPIRDIDPDGMRTRQIQDEQGDWHTINDDDVTNLYTAPDEEVGDDGGAKPQQVQPKTKGIWGPLGN